VTDTSGTALLRFGTFELDLEAEQLLKNGRLVHLQPQPFKLLCLLTSKTGKRQKILASSLAVLALALVLVLLARSCG
jgi:DNA-binding response OmpR family regulator